MFKSSRPDQYKRKKAVLTQSGTAFLNGAGQRHFGIEARYTDIGSFSNGFETLELSSISAHLVGYIPFGRSGWELSGQIGYAQVNQEVSDYYSEEDTAGSLGVAIRWHVNPSFAIGAQIDAYAWQNDELGPEYDVSSGTYLFSIQFNF